MEERVGCVIYALVALFILFAIVLGGGNKSSESSKSEWHRSTPYSRHQKNKVLEEQNAKKKYKEYQLKKQNEIIKNLPKSNPSSIPQGTISTSITPDDAETDGYNNGYNHGVYDKNNDYAYGTSYDESSSYYDYYETRYIQGYAEGYEAGYYGY